MNFKKLFSSLLAISATAAGLVVASDATFAASKVNNYISNNNIEHVEITSSVWNGFPKNKYNTGKPKGVVVHETANPNSTIYNEIAFMKRNYRNAFVHTFIDSSKIINIANTNYLSWGAGFPANGRYVQFEQVRVHSKKAFAKEVANAAYYTAYILNQYGLKPDNATNDGKGNVWSHAAAAKYLGGSNHTDPVGYYSSMGSKYFGQAYTMNQFYDLVETNFENLQADKAPINNDGDVNGNLVANNKKKLDVVTYKDVDQTGKLSKKYKEYRLYNHVKNSRKKVKKYKWSVVKAKVGKKVYIDNDGVKENGHHWYRIAFSNAKNAKKYWVYEKALKLNESKKVAVATVPATDTDDVQNDDAKVADDANVTTTNDDQTAADQATTELVK